MNRCLTYEELRVGDKWISPSRTVTEQDVMEFAELTGDFDPLYVESGSEFESPYGRPIAHGLLGLSLVAGLGSDNPRTATAAFVSLREWRFVGPNLLWRHLKWRHIFATYLGLSNSCTTNQA